MKKQPKVVVISGPTAIGKTSLGVALALALDGEIINADSMQVYRGMDIGTAKPTEEEKRGIPHHLLDVVEPDETFNASIYRSMALPKISDIASRRKSCFVVGGTGLYIKSLLNGLFDCPQTDMKLRESLQLECEKVGSAVLHERLCRLDPESARTIHPNDRVRVVRALEVILLTNRRLSDLKRSHAFGDRNLDVLKICLRMEREALYDRIDRRSAAMVEGGLVRETESLLAMGYSPDLKPMQAIGYRHVIQYLNGEWSIEKTISELQSDTRRYAKRQLTWFRSDPEVFWMEPEPFEMILRKVRAFLFENP